MSVQSVTLTAGLILSAYATAFAVQSGRHAWLGFLALIPLFTAIRILRPAAAVRAGAVWGASLSIFLHASGSVHGFPAAALLIGISSAYTGLGAALTRWIGFSPFVLGVGWMGVELASSFAGLPLGLLAASQSDTALVDHLGRALGYVVVGFLVAYVNALLVEIFGDVPRRLPRPSPVTTSSRSVFVLKSQVAGWLPRSTLQPCRPRPPPWRVFG